MTKQTLNREQIKWACRRGMLEMDILLGNFFADCFDHLTTNEQATFIHLLSLPDPDLFAWILGHKPLPDDQALAALIQKINQHAKLRSLSNKNL